MYIFYGVSSFVATASNLARPFMPFKVRVVKDLAAAMRLITQASVGTDAGGSLSAGSHDQAAGVPAELQRYVDELLEYIGRINWEADGLDDVGEAEPSHPFNQVNRRDLKQLGQGRDGREQADKEV